LKVLHTTASARAFFKAPPAVQKAFLKQIELLSENLRHPSLRAKKYDESQGLWQARVDRNWRFYFTIDYDVYVIQDLIPHPK
jgi:hypothetical protein